MSRDFVHSTGHLGSAFEFHISRKCRDKYRFDETIYSSTGNVVFPNFTATRRFAQAINAKRQPHEKKAQAGYINAMGLIDEIFHYVIDAYRQMKNPLVFRQALEFLEERVGREKVNELLKAFSEEFPVQSVYIRDISVEEYLAGTTAGIPNKLVVLEEMVVLWLANMNPAYKEYIELFEDLSLAEKTVYKAAVEHIIEFFKLQPEFGPDNTDLVTMLRSPAIVVPHSVFGQLRYILERWGFLLPARFKLLILSSMDMIKEEEKVFFDGKGEAQVPSFVSLMHEKEAFTPDRDWMPRLVLIAKNSYVWLWQLSKKYGREIKTLDQIPDEELDILARWGFTGLWLIGLWERSKASQRIKQLCGNPDAAPSAYSLYDYVIASELGGEAAFQNLRDRAWQRAIRLETDMVLNHMGIDSRWVVDHPDWFIQLDYPPFPAYTFNGPDLSSDSRVSIFIEDHYYNRTDAAVVFKFHDKRDGRVRYIYHGNDGTRMPWNDTAQFNYLKPEVREAMIQTVLYVAKKFPIIRFDAAMTLTKMHYARLWFPEPGHGGDIPSRAGHGMTKEEFNRVMPEEFWRTVVDRVAKEAPDTLLLAEAFWLLEGYFVRTLGMHRVYNSAFMNMLRDEKNAEYRAVIKNTIEFDPEILKRYVNFLNNPDEETAVAQFGKGDKYFGITIMMCTLPGLPMFGHGQIEGFTEKYGMEYKRAYYDEKPDLWLVSRHEKEVFPLIRKRYLFAESANFRLYDLFTESGSVDENVFAYSNRRGEEKALVLYNNHFGTSRGWIRISAAYAVKSVAHGEGNSSEETPLEKRLVQETLADALRLHDAPGWFVIMKDMISSQEYIFESRSLCSKGMWVELEGYKCRVFMEIREVVDDEEHYISRLCYSLQGRGVKNIEHAIKMMKLEKVHRTFRDLFNLGMKGWIRRCIYEYCEHVLSGGSVDREGEVRKEIADANIADAMNAVHEANKNFNKMREEIGWKLTALVQEIKHFSRIECNSEKAVGKVLSGIDGLVHLLACMRIEEKDPEYIKELKTGLNSGLKQEPERFYALIDFILLKSMESAFIESLSSLPDNNMDAELLLHQTETQSKKETSVDLRESYKKTRELIDAMELGRILEEEYRAEPYMREKGVKYLHLFKWLIPEHRILMDSDKTYREKIETLLLNEDFRSFVNVNFYNGILWFSKEIFEEAMFFLQATSCIQICSAILQPADAVPERTSEYKEIVYKKAEVVWRDIKSILTAAEKSGYKLDALLGNLENHNSNSRTPEDEIKKN